jgi:hypothetical protein
MLAVSWPELERGSPASATAFMLDVELVAAIGCGVYSRFIPSSMQPDRANHRDENMQLPDVLIHHRWGPAVMYGAGGRHGASSE